MRSDDQIPISIINKTQQKVTWSYIKERAQIVRGGLFIENLNDKCGLQWNQANYIRELYRDIIYDNLGSRFLQAGISYSAHGLPWVSLFGLRLNYYNLVFVCLIQWLIYILWMKKISKTFSLEGESGVYMSRMLPFFKINILYM